MKHYRISEYVVMENGDGITRYGKIEDIVIDSTIYYTIQWIDGGSTTFTSLQFHRLVNNE